MQAKWLLRSIGQFLTPTYRLYFEKDGSRISPWHDIPYKVSRDTFRYVVEIPKGTNAKIEIDVTDEVGKHPLKQDIKNGKLRFVTDVNGFKGYPCNYGAMPQTWEDPKIKYEPTGTFGDKDPLDVIDIASAIHERGQVKTIKVLGAYLLIDEGETDWKIIGIDVDDPESSKFNELEDIDKQRPGYLLSIRDWFRDYKIAEGKLANTFAWEGKAQPKSFALEVIEEAHKQWQNHPSIKALYTHRARI